MATSKSFLYHSNTDTSEPHFVWMATNMTHIDENEPYKSKLPGSVDYILSSYMLVIAVISVSLNLLVLLTMYHRRRSLSTPEFYIINLAVIDLLHTFYAHPQVIIAGFKHTWPFGKIACQIYAAGVFFFGTCSISTLAAMSVMRYIKVCCSRLDSHISRKTTMYTFIPVYLNGVIWSTGPLLGWGSYRPEPYGLSCTINWFKPSWSYIICIFLFVYILPLSTMMFCYCKMVRVVNKAGRQVRMVPTRLEFHLTKICTLMCVCFMIAWTPYAVVALVYTFRPSTNIPHILSVSAPYFAKSSTCYNPIVYFLSVKRFREEAKGLFYQFITGKNNNPNNNSINIADVVEIQLCKMKNPTRSTASFISRTIDESSNDTEMDTSTNADNTLPNNKIKCKNDTSSMNTQQTSSERDGLLLKGRGHKHDNFDDTAIDTGTNDSEKGNNDLKAKFYTVLMPEHNHGANISKKVMRSSSDGHCFGKNNKLKDLKDSNHKHRYSLCEQLHHFNSDCNIGYENHFSCKGNLSSVKDDYKENDLKSSDSSDLSCNTNGDLCSVEPNMLNYVNNFNNKIENSDDLLSNGMKCDEKCTNDIIVINEISDSVIKHNNFEQGFAKSANDNYTHFLQPKCNHSAIVASNVDSDTTDLPDVSNREIFCNSFHSNSNCAICNRDVCDFALADRTNFQRSKSERARRLHMYIPTIFRRKQSLYMKTH